MEESDNRRIAKNTLVLYCRTIFTMLISLYTSRIVLSVLGVDNYGIFNVVGGLVSMFSVISGSLSSAISRFITFELGRKNYERLQTIFSTSVNVQICLSIVIILVAETIGVWFLNHKMDIPSERLYAANWVLQCSILSFCIGLISVPYNALIIAHEKMSAFAYISIIEVSLKLLIVYSLYISPFDKLITYSILTIAISIVIRLIYGNYSKRHFEEAKYRFTLNKSLFLEMASFAGWSFLTNAACILNTSGVNILINLYFGVVVNAARGVASQVEGAVTGFVNNFTMALNPQITKNYAAGNYSDMNILICRGSKFSYFLLFILSLPIMMETGYILRLWLKEVPDYTLEFIRLGFIATMSNIIGGTGYTACMATGNIKKYTIVITSVGFLVFPLAWIFFKSGLPPYSSCYVYILVYLILDVIRLFLMRGMFNFPIMLFVREVISKIIIVTLASIIIPLIVIRCIEPSFARLILSVFTCLICSSISIFYCGLSKGERAFASKTILDKVEVLKKHI